MKYQLLIILFLCYLCQSLVAQRDSVLADSIYAQAKEFYYADQYDTAQTLFQQSLSLKKKFYGPEHEEIVWNYHRLARTAEELRDYQTAFIYYDSAFTLAVRIKGEEDEIIADLSYDIGFAYASQYQVREANAYFERALKVYGKIEGKESVAVAEVLTQIGNNYMSAGDYRTAEEYLVKALAILRQRLEPDAKSLYPVYNYLAYLNRKLENYDLALDYAQRALDIKTKYYAPDHRSVAKYHRNIGRIYQEQGDFETAFPYFETALKILEDALGPEHPSTGGAYGEYGNILADLERYDEALNYIKRANRVRSRYNDTLHPLVIAGDHNIAYVYRDKGDYPNSLKYHQKGLRKFLARSYPPPLYVAKVYRDISQVYEEMENPSKGLEANREAMRWLSSGFNPPEKNLFALPDLDRVRSPIDFLDALEDRAYLLRDWFKEDTSKVERLAQALVSLEKGVEVVEKLRRRYDSETALQYLNDSRSNLFELGVQTAWELYQRTGDKTLIQKAFELSEKSRASILWQSLQENIALQGSGLDDSFVRQLESIGREISRLEGELQSLEEESSDRESIANLEKEIFEKKLEYQSKIDLLETNNPRYYQLKYAEATVDWQGLRRELTENDQILLQYYYDDENFYLFWLNDSGLQLHVQSLPSDFLDQVERICSQKVNTLLQDGAKGKSAYQQALFAVYDLLIGPVEKEIGQTGRLLIIPYGVLQYIPFGILARESTEDDFRKLSYLIKTHSIQYAWSVSLLQQQDFLTADYKQDYLGFAPKFAQTGPEEASPQFAFRTQLTALTFNQREIEKSQDYFSGQSYLGDQATEQQFYQTAPFSRILHLATHTLVDDEQPLQSGLVFSETADSSSDGFLSTREIYDLQLPAELAVMSACNTGFGKLSKGEGVLSLGRAFTYAGCRSIMMSLWLSNDQSTASLVDHFYRHLADGKNKDEALRQAKLDYLKAADGLMAHPYFWGGMVMVGEHKPLSRSTPWYLFVGLGALAVFFLGYLRYTFPKLTRTSIGQKT